MGPDTKTRDGSGMRIPIERYTLAQVRFYGEAIDRARKRKERTLATINRWYEREGAIFEYYDALDVTSPRELDRKQRLSSGKGMAPVSDYHWSASAVVALTAMAAAPRVRNITKVRGETRVV